MAGFVQPPMSMPTSTVELSIRCAKLSDSDFLSKSDPVAIIFDKLRQDGKSSEWREVWRSEMILNDLNPSWKRTFVHDYRFEEHQAIKIEIYDWDTADEGVAKNLEEQDFIGSIETNMAAIVSSR